MNLIAPIFINVKWRLKKDDIDIKKNGINRSISYLCGEWGIRPERIGTIPLRVYTLSSEGFRNSFNHSDNSLILFIGNDLQSDTQFISCSSSWFPFRGLKLLCGKSSVRNIPKLMDVSMMCSNSYHQSAYSFFYQDHHTDLHKRSHLWGSLKYRHKSIQCSCGEWGIRTLDTLASIHTFQACSFNHSDNSPFFKWTYLSVSTLSSESIRNSFDHPDNSPFFK
jgi:hypothetical protein